MPERFEDAIKALRHVAYGNGNVMRIADRIVAAHEREIAATKLAAEMPTYDVEGNERHKAACELRGMKICKISRHMDFVLSLATRLHITRPENRLYKDYELHELIRDKLVSLLEGECNFSTPESYMACEDGDPNPAETSPDEQTSVTLGTHSPITGELRDVMSRFDNFNGVEVVTMHGADFDRCCDAIDSVHAQLERENDELRVKFVNANRHALHVERENESLKAELDRVLGEQDEDEYAPITTEMRLSLGFFNGLTDFERDKFTQLCDAIDAVHAHLEQNYADAISALDLALREQESTLIHHRPDTWESIIYDAMQAGRTDITLDVTPLIERCKALAGDAE